MWEVARRAGWAAAVLGLSACGGEPQAHTGGTDIEPGPFGRGLFVIDTDYQSTNVSLLGLDGAILSLSFTSSYESGLSWDVSAPTTASTGEDVVLLDRTFHLVTWVDVRTGDVRAQFHVDGDELAQNPWDYVPVGADKAYVLRYDPVPGKGDHGDVIVVHPAAETVTSPVRKRVELASAIAAPKGTRIHPARGVSSGGKVYLTTVAATEDYEYSNSYLVVIDAETDEVVATKEIAGLRDCNAIALSPDGEELALACSGDLEAYSATSLDGAGVVRIARGDLSEKARYPAAELGFAVPGFSITYAGPQALAVTLVGNVADGTDDAAIAIDLGTGEPSDLRRAGQLQLGAALCPARVDGATADPDPEVCFLTDADDFAVLRFPIEKGTFGAPRKIHLDEGRTRPPRYLGQF